MPTITSTLTSTYLPTPSAPVGFEATLEVYDTTAGGGAGQTFVTCITIDTVNATYWTLSAEGSTGLKNNNGTYTRHPANVYDPQGITATWTERISDVAATPTRYVLRGKFDAPGGMIQVRAQSAQINDSINSSGELALAVAIATPQGL
jgi:hypothetical protein